MFSVNHGLDLYAIANQFPASVQQEVFYEEHRHRLLQVPMFRCLSKDDLFLAAIARALRVMVVLDGDNIFQAGEVGDRMYFIKKGARTSHRAEAPAATYTLDPNPAAQHVHVHMSPQDPS